MAFLISEDEALKQYITGLTVSDQNVAERRVKVWFNLPEAEEREISYPYLSINLLDVEEDLERAQRGRIRPGYVPEGYDPAPIGSDNKTETPLPVVLLYQVTSFARSAWHDRQLSAQMFTRLPWRFGSLYVEADETVRTLQLVDVQSFDGLDKDRKRVFRKAYTLSVESELFPDGLLAVQRVTQVNLDVYGSLEPLTVGQRLVP